MQIERFMIEYVDLTKVQKSNKTIIVNKGYYFM